MRLPAEGRRLRRFRRFVDGRRRGKPSPRSGPIDERTKRPKDKRSCLLRQRSKRRDPFVVSSCRPFVGMARGGRALRARRKSANPVFHVKVRDVPEVAGVARGERTTVPERDGGDEQVHRRNLNGLAAQFRFEFPECPGGVRSQSGFRKHSASRFICTAVSASRLALRARCFARSAPVLKAGRFAGASGGASPNGLRNLASP